MSLDTDAFEWQDKQQQTDPHVAQQSSSFTSTELTGVYIVPRLCASDETDTERWIQTSKTKGTGEIQSDFIQGMKQDVKTTEQNGVENHRVWVQRNHAGSGTETCYTMGD